MTTEQYRKQMERLGINRGALHSGFNDSGITVHKPPDFLPKRKGPILVPAPQDLSHLNPYINPNSKQGGRKKKNGATRPRTVVASGA